MKMNLHTKRKIDHFDKYASGFKNADLLTLDKAAAYEFKSVVQQLPLTKQSTIIDLGCGIGKYSLLLARKGHRVTAVDISSKSLNLVKTQAIRYGIKTIHTYRGDFSTVIFKNKYEIGLCISTYHMLAEKEEDKIKTLGNFIQSIKPGGTLLLVEPNPFNPLFYLFYLLYPGVQRENIRSFLGSSPFHLREILRSLGMKDIRIQFVGFLPLRWMKTVPAVRFINEMLNRIPIINSFSAFSYITARK